MYQVKCTECGQVKSVVKSWWDKGTFQYPCTCKSGDYVCANVFNTNEEYLTKHVRIKE